MQTAKVEASLKHFHQNLFRSLKGNGKLNKRIRRSKGPGMHTERLLRQEVWRAFFHVIQLICSTMKVKKTST